MAMSIDDYKQYLAENVCMIKFTKQDGSTRVLHATTKEALIPENLRVGVNPSTKKAVPPHPTNVRCFDVEIDEWRSFDINSVISFAAP